MNVDPSGIKILSKLFIVGLLIGSVMMFFFIGLEFTLKEIFIYTFIYTLIMFLIIIITIAQLLLYINDKTKYIDNVLKVTVGKEVLEEINDRMIDNIK